MKRILALGLCLALLCPAARAAEEAKGWSRSEPGGDYVTLRVPCPQGEALDWSEQTLLAVRYADTGEPVPLTSDYQQGWLFATVPAAEAAFLGALQWSDTAPEKQPLILGIVR